MEEKKYTVYDPLVKSFREVSMNGEDLKRYLETADKIKKESEKK